MTKKTYADLIPRLNSVVAFEMGGEKMVLPTDVLREVLELPTLTPVPCAGDFSAGLINIRGVVLPVADWRPLFGMPLKAADRETRILIIETSVNEQTMTVGVIAEKVHAITEIEPDTLRPVPAVGTRWPTGTLLAMARWNDAFVAIPDVVSIFENQISQEPQLVGAE
ncbi:chemotaxis protein CheW [Donghicola sp. XS_ASV15]|uniref:chemotaxis protein CheW n=1 Tax=Donghicola sp. XS_ASV15 TaxID=3241295 RepID=UPI003515E167